MKKKIIVIGSGISGLSISKMLKPRFEVTILERAAQIGGLIKCTRVNGSLFHLVGGHVFNSRNPVVLDWFWKHFDKENEFVKAERNAKILLNGQLIGYPIENFIYRLSEENLQRIIKELLQIAINKTDPRRDENFESFLKNSFGETLYDIYFGPYNAKLWNTDLAKVPLDWLDGKLPMPQVQDILVNNISQNKETGMVHSSFYYPVSGGSQFIVDRMAAGLTIHPSYEVSSIKYTNGILSVNGDSYTAEYLVYCGDVRKLHSIVEIEDKPLQEAMNAIKELPSNGTSNVLCETDDTDISWLYLPESKFMSHRIIYTGNFSDTNNQSGRRKTCVVEFSGRHKQEDMIQELQNLPGNLEALAFNYEPNSYIIQHHNTRDKINTLKRHLAKYNIFLLGRFAQWEYFNMDKCIEAAMELESVLSGKETD